MPVLLDYQRAFGPEASPEDRRLLRRVVGANYVWGVACLTLFGFPFGLSLCVLPFHGMADEPGVSGLRMIRGMLATTSPGVLVGALTISSAKWIARRTRRRTFSVRWSVICACVGIAAMSGLLVYVARARWQAPGVVIAGLLLAAGAVVGIGSYRVLTRQSVGLLYAARGAGATVPADAEPNGDAPSHPAVVDGSQQ